MASVPPGYSISPDEPDGTCACHGWRCSVPSGCAARVIHLYGLNIASPSEAIRAALVAEMEHSHSIMIDRETQR
jgi:hypothetical protein